MGSIPGLVSGWAHAGLVPLESEGAKEWKGWLAFHSQGELRKLMFYQEAQASDPSSGRVWISGSSEKAVSTP